jgi:hypothetical protein
VRALAREHGLVVTTVFAGSRQDALKALEPRLAINLIPLPEPVQEAGHRIGRPTPEAGCGRGALERRAKGLTSARVRTRLALEPAIAPRGMRRSADTHRGSAPSSMPAKDGVATGVSSPSRSAAFWSDDRSRGRIASQPRCRS